MRYESVLNLSNVSYMADNKNIVSEVSFSLDEKKTYALVGPSGSGKTTILMLMNGLISPTSGKILYKGDTIEGLDMPMYRSVATLMFQEPLLVPGNGRDNLLMPYSLESNKGKDPSESDMARILSECGLCEEYLDKDTSTFSGGEKQRLSLARTILMRPEIMMLDEPTSALDMGSERDIISLLERQRQHCTIFYVTHSYQLIERADNVMLLKDGRIQSMVDSIGKEQITEFLGDSPWQRT